MARIKWGKSLFISALCLVIFGLPLSALADGLPAGSDRTQGTSSEWPPKGAASKGSLGDGTFTGTWYAFVDNTAFTIIIEQEGRTIKGAHTAVYDYGRRVDSSNGGVSMSGGIEGVTAYVEWKSGLSPDTGKATIEYLPGRPATLHWKIIDEAPKPGDQNEATTMEVGYFLPRSAYLIRKPIQ